MEQNVLAIFGSFVSLLLMINAYYTRRTLEQLQKIEIKLVEYTTKHDSIEEIAKSNSKELQRTRDRLHKLEGSIGSLTNLIPEITKE